MATSVGSFLCVIPGIIFAFLALFADPIRRRPVPVAHRRDEGQLSRRSGPTSAARLLSWLVQSRRCSSANRCAVVGLLVGFPVALLVLTYTYRKLSGGQVVPLEQPGYPQGPPPGVPPGPCPQADVADPHTPGSRLRQPYAELRCAAACWPL